MRPSQQNLRRKKILRNLGGLFISSCLTNIHDQGLLGVFKEANATKVINLIERINRNALPVDERLAG